MKLLRRVLIVCALFVIFILLIGKSESSFSANVFEHDLVYAGPGPVLDKFVYLPIVVKPKDPVYKIVFSSNRTDNSNYDIFIMNTDGTDLVNLTNSTDIDESDPIWSPDGTKIAYSVGNEGSQEIHVMNNDGANKINVSNNSGSEDRFPVWAPDSSKLGFVSDRVNQDGVDDVFVVNADGTGLVNLTNSTNGDELTMDWSPDGSKIVYTVNNNVSGIAYVIMKMNADGTNKTLIDTGRQANLFAEWGPGNNKITFALSNECLAMINSDGSDYQPCFTDQSEFASIPVPFEWNQDGSQLFFNTIILGEFQEKWFIYDTANTQTTEFDPAELNSFRLSNWSLDGTQLIGSHTGEFGSGSYIFVINLDGTGFSQLTEKGDSVDFFDGSPSWSPVKIR